MKHYKKIQHKKLLDFLKKILTKYGLDKFSMQAVSEGLYDASLRGVDSHGINLLPHYLKSAVLGRKNPKPLFSFKKKYPAVGILDSDNAFGHAAGYKAVDYGMKLAKKYGIGLVSVINSSHPGAMASIALRGAKLNYLVFAFTHADSLMLSHNGKRAYFGTNPICFAVPRKNDEPYCLDMATTNISWNKLLNHKKNKKILGLNLAADKMGKMTTKADRAATLFPIGGYKGFGLASMVEILCGVYSGMDFGRKIKPMYTTSLSKKRKLGQLYIIIKPDGAIDLKSFLNRMNVFSKEVRKEPSIKKKSVMLPNDPEIICSKKRLKEGIPIDLQTYESIKKISQTNKIKFF